jgi:predicted Na+-dependent transporter
MTRGFESCATLLGQIIAAKSTPMSVSLLAKALTFLSHRGPVILVLSLIVGLGAGAASEILRELLPVAAFLLTLGSFLSAGLARREAGVGKAASFGLLWIIIVFPAVAMLILQHLHLDQDLAFGILLALIAPPVGSAAAIASMLGLKPRLALIVSIVATGIAPLTIPVYLWVYHSPVEFNLGGLMLRLVLIVTAAVCVTAFVIKNRKITAALIPDAKAAAGFSVIGLVIIGTIASADIANRLAVTPGHYMTTLSIAVLINFGCCLLGAALFSGWGLKGSLTMGLLTGNRNVTLAWAFAGSALPSGAEAYVAAAVLPILALPLLMTIGLSLVPKQHDGAVKPA